MASLSFETIFFFFGFVNYYQTREWHDCSQWVRQTYMHLSRERLIYCTQLSIHTTCQPFSKYVALSLDKAVQRAAPSRPHI